MVLYDFQAPDADATLRSSDEKEFHVHKIILSLASPVFRGMFGLPQPTGSLPQIPIVDVTESSDILQPFIQYLYPCSPPKVPDVTMWSALYIVADKYQAEGVMDSLRNILPKFLETSPLRVYALASRWGLEEEARTASTRTLALDILRDFAREDAELMGGAACHKLFLLHLNRREAVQTFIVRHPRPTSPIGTTCPCPATPLVNFILTLCHRVGTRPLVTLGEVHEVANRQAWPKNCGRKCRFSHGSMNKYFRSLARGISELPLSTG